MSKTTRINSTPFIISPTSTIGATVTPTTRPPVTIGATVVPTIIGTNRPPTVAPTIIGATSLPTVAPTTPKSLPKKLPTNNKVVIMCIIAIILIVSVWSSYIIFNNPNILLIIFKIFLNSIVYYN